MIRSVALNEHDVEELEQLGYDLLHAGDIRATKILTLALAWQFAPEVKPQEFHCEIDESAGLAELYELDPHSRRVSA